MGEKEGHNSEEMGKGSYRHKTKPKYHAVSALPSFENLPGALGTDSFILRQRTVRLHVEFGPEVKTIRMLSVQFLIKRHVIRTERKKRDFGIICE